MSPEFARFGIQKSGRITKDLHVSADQLVLQASQNNNIYRFDLITGKLPSNYGLSRLYTTRWRIETPSADGGYQTLIEFKA